MNITYSLIMGTAMLAGYLVSRGTQRPLGLSRMERAGILFGAFCGAMVGAKLPFLFENAEIFLSGYGWLSSGKTILTGLVGGYLGVEVAKWSMGIRTRTGDSFVVPVATAIGVGRIACFVGGCCYGTPTSLPWGVVFPSVDQLARHPTQLYESAFHLTCAALMWELSNRHLFRGQLMKLYIILYAAYRFLTEFIRPEAKLQGGLTGYQWCALVMIVLFSWLWYRDARMVEAV